ncbi:TRAP transporter substrate-binding protein DctP [Oceanispirochaeta crateris]|nr:TRAP transporter substrate-binding protein DctP [Oceanispirochaeta crateris]
MKKNILILLLLMLIGTTTLSALTIKMGSLFPEGSAWDVTLKKMAREWSDLTNGKVRMKIYPGGIAGEESDMIRKMRIGQLDAAVLTNVGMTDIVTDSLIFSLPFLVQDEEELDFVVKELLPRFDDQFREKGFEVLIWSKSGWINFFSNSQIMTPEDLLKTRMAVSPNNPEMMEAFKALGFKIIPLGMNDTLMGLQSGMIDTFYSIPMAAAAFQWFALAPNLNPIDVTPVIGGIVISERAWQRIPDEYHAELKASMASVQREFVNETDRLNQEALRIMKDNGLQVMSPGENMEEVWRSFFKDSYSALVGENKLISEETYNEMNQQLDSFRANK